MSHKKENPTLHTHSNPHINQVHMRGLRLDLMRRWYLLDGGSMGHVAAELLA